MWRAREAQGPQRLRPLRGLPENQRGALMAWAAALDQDLAARAEPFAVPMAAVRSILQAPALPSAAPQRWQRQTELWQQRGARYWPLQQAVAAVAAGVVRASRVIANLNSRLRHSCFLRRPLGPD